MRKMLKNPAVRLVCWYLVLTFSGALLLPSAAQAAFLSPSRGDLAGMDDGALAAAREALEEGVLTERLSALGLSQDEIRQRLDSLTTEEREAVMADVERIQAGGNGVVTVLLVVLLVILILKLLDKDVVIR